MIVGEYELLDLIAEGGFGKTYKAKHLELGQLACLKHPHEMTLADEKILSQEAQIMWNLSHHSIPAVRTLLRMPDDKLALVMSYIPGPTLTQVVEYLADKGKRLDAEDVAWITERILNALRYIHYEGVVNGDLKPHNVILQPGNHKAYVVDFGLSKLKPKRRSGNKGYTEFFSAPEVVAGGTILPEADFYSLGMTMIFALTGDPEKLKSKEVPVDTPDPMVRFIERLIVRNPLDRPRWPETPDQPDLWDEFKQVRIDSFGDSRSHLKQIEGPWS
mgnify:CR=1 FL=1